MNKNFKFKKTKTFWFKIVSGIIEAKKVEILRKLTEGRSENLTSKFYCNNFFYL